MITPCKPNLGDAKLGYACSLAGIQLFCIRHFSKKELVSGCAVNIWGWRAPKPDL